MKFMKYIVLIISVVVLTGRICAQEAKPKGVGLAATEAESISNVISKYAQHTDDLRKLSSADQSPLRRRIIAYYEASTNQLPAKHKFVVAWCMGQENDFTNATKLLEEYVRVYTNSTIGWIMLGTASVMIDNNERGIEAYEKAVALGDEKSLSALAGVALQINRLDIVKKYVPDLLRLKDEKGPPDFIKQEVIGFLVVYASRTDNQELYLQALDKVKIDQLVSRTDVLVEVDKACHYCPVKNPGKSG